jgi:predicted transposase/invertase (TIGR01784 family)
LEANDPNQDWRAVALFADRAAEPSPQPPYEDLLASPRVHRIYLDELTTVGAAAPGLTLLQLVTAPKQETPEMVARLLDRAEQESDSERADVIVELVEELLMRRFTQLNREEVRRMFQLHDLRKSRVWQEAHEEGMEKGMEKGRVEGMEIGRAEGMKKGRAEGMEKGKIQTHRELIQRLIAQGKSLHEIAKLLNLSLARVRRLANP